jgi:hypothetical protein
VYVPISSLGYQFGLPSRTLLHTAVTVVRDAVDDTLALNGVGRNSRALIDDHVAIFPLSTICGDATAFIHSGSTALHIYIYIYIYIYVSVYVCVHIYGF